jgi:predicted transcriptional regulator
MKTHHVTTLKIPARTKERIQMLAAIRKRSAHALMLEALDINIARKNGARLGVRKVFAPTTSTSRQVFM